MNIHGEISFYLYMHTVTQMNRITEYLEVKILDYVWDSLHYTEIAHALREQYSIGN